MEKILDGLALTILGAYLIICMGGIIELFLGFLLALIGVLIFIGYIKVEIFEEDEEN